MTTRRNSAALLASAGILATGWSIGTAHGQTLTTTVPATSTTSGTTAGAASGTTSGATTYTGTRQSDRWGSLQVTITVASGKITNVTYTTTAGDGKSLSIEARATPTLKSEVLAAQSAQVSTVSGATYTSTKYLTSLQSAIDQMG
ncbi:MAG TPA: FMN-binding protein [Dermatophilaceae bacterium]|mgnify:FL=1|jgi:uncharacterized protein with FMN-binding domain|nr:FMN-binding protein [Actinomycetales bacterium]HMT33912.1 FMN-binding protein [Dermatophilaceae bacterium]HMT89619.1 FMN-binding protein [Dermatophilaceae bacterium]